MKQATKPERRSSARMLFGLISALVLLALALPAPAQALTGVTVRAHDPSLIKVGSCTYAFSTGFENDPANPLGAPLSYKSCGNDGSSNWQLLGPVWSTSPTWPLAQFGAYPRNYWAPDISVRNGVYYLYYVAAIQVGKVGTGLLTSTNIEGPWTDQGMVTRDLDPIDPEIVTNTSGTRFLLEGGFQGTNLYSIDQSTGKITGSPTKIATGIENPSIVYNGGFYYLTGSKGLCCAANNSTYQTVIGRSTSLSGPYVDLGGVNMNNGGGTTWLTGTWPRIAAGGGEFYWDGTTLRHAYHYYEANAAQTERLAIRNVGFLNGWPIAESPLGESSVTIKNANSNMCADLWGASNANQAPINQGSCSGVTNQKWTATLTGGSYEFKSASSGQCMEIYGASTVAGTHVTQWPCNSSSAQKWQRVPLFGGFSEFKNVASGQCLEVYGNANDNGHYMNQWPCNGGANQQWIVD